MSSPAGDLVPEPSHSFRKRQRSPDPRERTVAKKRCSLGQASSSDDPGGGSEVTVGPPCGDGCFDEVGPENVRQIFTDFQRMHGVSKQNEYLASLIRISEVTRNPQCYDPSGITTVRYTVKCQNRIVTVCSVAFQSIHGIGKGQFYSVLRKVSDATIVERYRKAADKKTAKDRKATEDGKVADRKAKERKTLRWLVREHMNCIPLVTSSYSRAKHPDRKYFPFIDFQKLYELYIDWLLENYPNSPPYSSLCYDQVLDDALTFHLDPPKMDMCSECDKMKQELKSRRAAQDIETCQKQKLNRVHLQKVKETHELVDMYRQDQDPKVAVISMDLQQTLPLPQTSTNLQYYKRRLWTYTVDIHNMKSGRATMHLWDETCARPGSAEVASCLLHYIDREVDDGIDRLVIFSSSCGGQIKNWNIVATYMRLIHTNRFKKIEHFFMMPGHSILPWNLDFDRIQSFVQENDRKVYDLDHYANVIREAQTNHPFTVVKMQRSMFKDIQVLSDMITKRSSIKSMSFRNARAFIVDNSRKDSVGILNAHSLRQPYWIRVEGGNGTGSGPCLDLSSVPLPEKYSKPVRISKQKMTDLKALLPCIEPQYKPYFVGVVKSQKDSVYVAVSSHDAKDNDMLDYVHSTYSSYSLTAAQTRVLEQAVPQPPVLPSSNVAETQTSSVRAVIVPSREQEEPVHEEEKEDRPCGEEDPLYTGPESSEWMTVKSGPQRSLVDAPQHLSEKTQTLGGLDDSIKEEIEIKKEEIKDLETGRAESIINEADRTTPSSHHCPQDVPETNNLQPDREESHQDNISISHEEGEKIQTLDGLDDSIKEEIEIKKEEIRDLETGSAESIINEADKMTPSSHHCPQDDPETNNLQPDREESHQDNSVSHEEELDSSQLSIEGMEDNETEEDQRKRQEGTRQLKSLLEDLGKFFVFDSYVKTEKDTQEGKVVHTGRARCQEKTCLEKGGKAASYTYTTRSKGNLKKHYEKMHRAMLPSVRAAFEGVSKRGRSKAKEDELPAKRGGRQLCMEESFSWKDRVTPELLRKTCTRHFFSLLSPEFSAPSRRTLGRDIDQAWATAKSDLSNALYEASYVATTADSWTAHNRAFIGMTCHWIGQNLRRQRGTLACKEIKEKQTNVVLAQAIYDTHQEFGLGNKVVATTTDNGTNYVAAFKYFGAGDVPVEGEEEQDPEVVVGQPANLHAQLEEVVPAMIKLPKHYRCSAHTLNLIATADVHSVPGWNQGFRAPFTKAAAKAQGTWNLQNRSSVVTNSIKEKTGRKLKTFCVTRWNSYYDAIQSLMDVLSNPEKMRAMNEILSKGGAATFNEIDKHVLSEYLKVMQPVAECLDSLQSETNAYMGTLMPALQLMQFQLERLKVDRNLQFALPLVSALLGKEGSGKGCYGRFADQLQDADILMATALHPHYTMSLVRHFNPHQAANIQGRIVREVKEIVGTELERQPEERKERVDKFHLLLSSATVPEVRCQEEVEETIVKTLEDWKREMVDIPLSPNLFPARYRDAWLDLFKRYNTPLPSSAAVERLFSSAGDILRAKRSSLSNVNFEQLVFVRGNMHLLDYKDVGQQHMEEEQDL